jgi:hypothetical protein
MASAVPLVDARARSARREAYRQARDLTGHLAEQRADLDELDAQPDPSETIQLHESARLAVGAIVRLLALECEGSAAPRLADDPAQLDAWVQLLDELLTDAQAGDDGTGDHGRALAASRDTTDAIAMRPAHNRQAQRRRLDAILAELRAAATDVVPSPSSTEHGEAQR